MSTVAHTAAGIHAVEQELTIGPAPLPLAAPPTAIFVVPAFNEIENLPRLFADLEARPGLFDELSHVIVVDDGSDDGTPELVRAYDGPLNVRLVELAENQGPGAAFRAGFGVALLLADDNTIVVTLEADTTSDLDAMPAMLGCLAGGADVVLASVHGGCRMMNVGLLRRILSRGAGFVVRKMLKIDARTVSSFFRIYRIDVLRRAIDAYGDDLIEEAGFACKAELLAKLLGLGARVDEVPVDLDGSRRVGESKMAVLPTMLGYWRLMRRRTVGNGAVGQ